MSAEVELREPGYDPDQDFLRRIFGILAIAQHAQHKAEEVALQGADQAFEGVAIALQGRTGQFFQSGVGSARLEFRRWFIHSPTGATANRLGRYTRASGCRA